MRRRTIIGFVLVLAGCGVLLLEGCGRLPEGVDYVPLPEGYAQQNLTSAVGIGCTMSTLATGVPT